MTEIADFDDAEAWVIKNAAQERVGQPVAAQFADTELRLHSGIPILTTCSERGAHLMIFKVAPQEILDADFL